MAEALVRYDFRVSKIISGYQLRVDNRTAVVSYHGSFWADPKTLEAARLEVIADDIPSDLGLVVFQRSNRLRPYSHRRRGLSVA